MIRWLPRSAGTIARPTWRTEHVDRFRKCLSRRRRVSLAAGLLAAILLRDRRGNAPPDWARFRGPNGSGVSPDAAPAPVTWSETENLKWSVDLPGRGVSCPIVVGDRVYVTSWTGDGADDLVRHLVCYDRATGKQIFDKASSPP